MNITLGELRQVKRECIEIIDEDSSKVQRQFDTALAKATGMNVEVPTSFKGSKMVDASGNPIVFYHGTRRDFSKFSKEFLDTAGTAIPTNYLGFYFTSSPDVAKIYISKHFDPKREQHSSGMIRKFFLDVKKPYYITEKTYWKWGHGSAGEMEDLVTKLRSSGYDGIVMPSVWRGKGKGTHDVVVFSSDQIIEFNDVD